MRRDELAGARKAAGYTQEALAEALHVDRATVNRWEAGSHAPLPYLRPKLGRLLGRTTQQLHALLTPGSGNGSGRRLPVSADVEVACDWLDLHASWKPGTSRRLLVAQLDGADVLELRTRDLRRSSARRSALAEALVAYYTSDDTYRVRYDGAGIGTTILTQADWVGLGRPLGAETDRFRLASATVVDDVVLDDRTAKRAVRRLVDAVALEVTIANSSLYRLLDFDIGGNGIGGTLGLVPFVQYALTVDLLEIELVDAVAGLNHPGTFPLRDRYLPTADSVADVSGRVCSGGVLALCAIARPADPNRGPSDYMLLVQGRAGRVVNGVGRLAVIPKGFHQPLSDVRADARIGSTLRRELEEELFGRTDVDGTRGDKRAADPMHPNRLSEPMRWMMEDPKRVRVECTGFGFNLVNGNFEYACLVVVEDEEFWARYGGQIEANWESAGLRQYSSLDRELVGKLVADESWSNEGLFAFLEGIRRLDQIGGERVNLPVIEPLA